MMEFMHFPKDASYFGEELSSLSQIYMRFYPIYWKCFQYNIIYTKILTLLKRQLSFEKHTLLIKQTDLKGFQLRFTATLRISCIQCLCVCAPRTSFILWMPVFHEQMFLLSSLNMFWFREVFKYDISKNLTGINQVH